MLVRGDETDGRYSLMHKTLRKGAAVPLHTHSRSDEHFYILAGEVTFLVGDDIWIGRAGDFIYVPRNTPTPTASTATRPLSSTATPRRGWR